MDVVDGRRSTDARLRIPSEIDSVRVYLTIGHQHAGHLFAGAIW